MPGPVEQVLTVAQMRAAEAELVSGGISIDALMERAGRGAAQWVWRLAAGRAVTVLCGPGNNGGDGWVIAEAIRELGGAVAVIAAAEPASEAARTARSRYRGPIVGEHQGDVLVDCLFGSGLTRPLGKDHLALLNRLAASHSHVVAVDLPSGVDADLGQPLNQGLPRTDLTLALGAWKFAHFLMPAAAGMGMRKLIDLSLGPVNHAAGVVTRPSLCAPGPDDHKYTRGLLGLVLGAMPGAALLAAQAAQGAGAGYVRLFGAQQTAVPSDLVASSEPLAEALADRRLSALLIGPGLGRDGGAREKLAAALCADIPTLLDADALVLLGPGLLAQRTADLIVTPHEGEMLALERAFALDGLGSKVERARALARASAAVVVAKGGDSVIAAPDGRTALAHRASSWLSTAGTGDVLAGIIASRLANGADAFDAACQGVWLHGEAARTCLAPFAASQLADRVRSAYAACL